MKSSRLAAIIKRLEAMQQDTEEGVQTRRFEQAGTERAEVSYEPETETYTVVETANHQTFSFDDIDLAAMEIFDTLDDSEVE